MINKPQLYLALIGGLIGGAIAGASALLLVGHSMRGSANVSNTLKPQETSQRAEKEKIIVKESNFTKAISKTEPSVVAIQSFNQGRLLRVGSGIVMTQDGLVVTLNSIVPPGAQVYQVSLGDQIYRGKVIYRDRASGLAVLSITANGLEVAKLKENPPELGENLLALAKTFNFSQTSVYVAQALVSYVDSGNESWKISLAYDQILYGGAVIDNDGATLGLINFQGQRASLIKPQTIKDVLNLALTKVNNP